MAASESKHGIVKTYVVLAVILCVITFIEWVIFKMEDIRTQPLIMVPGLLILSVAKFIMVAGWYMHLRFDHGWLWKIFAFAAVMATGTFVVLYLLI